MSTGGPGRVLRLALLAWGLGHLALGRRAIGWSLLASEGVALLLVAWLTLGLADSSAYLVPFVAGVAFLVAWAWQAVDAYRRARARLSHAEPATDASRPESPAAAIGWLSLPLLVWSAGFWLVAADAATPAATLDRFVTDWSSGTLVGPEWPSGVRRAAAQAETSLGSGADRFRDLRVSIVDRNGDRATAVVEAVHFERRPSSFLGIFPGSDLVPIADERLLSLELVAVPVELPGGGDIGAVRWELVAAEAG